MIIVRFFTIAVSPIKPIPEKGKRYHVVVTPYNRYGIGPVACAGDLLVWDVVGNGKAVVTLRGFKKTGRSAGAKLKMMGKLDDRRTNTKNGRIIDGVALDAEEGTYKYDVLIDGRLELDPEIRIRDSA
jgi:hypothetical protein